MKFSIGDKVRFLNEKGEGIVCDITSKKTVIIRLEEGLEIPYLVSELVAIHSDLNVKKEEKIEAIEKNSPLIKKKVRSTKPSISKPHAKNNPANFMEIDLHIEELMDNYKGMSNAEIVLVQLKYFQKALDRAISSHCISLTVIHGVGNGRLKEEVRKIVSYHNFRFHDASYAKYGFGATEVIIS